MADKASRGLVVYGEGLARYINNSHINNLNSFACKAQCGFLSLPLSPPTSESEDKRSVREFLQLLDACEDNSDVGGKSIHQAEHQVPTLSERFMGMKLAIVTNNPDLKSVGGKLGITIYQLADLTEDSSSNSLASKLLNLLGFQERKALEACPFDIIFLHVGGNEKNGVEDIQFVDNFVGSIMQLAAQGSEINIRLHMSVVMSYGSVSGNDDDSTLSVLDTNDGNNSVFLMLFPQQSYTVKGRNPRHSVRHHCPMLLAQWQNGVTRKDLAEAFSFKDFKEQGGMLTIPADRFIHEVAFKLWKAPKYGA